MKIQAAVPRAGDAPYSIEPLNSPARDLTRSLPWLPLSLRPIGDVLPLSHNSSESG